MKTMNLEKRMFLAEALLKYAQMHGYVFGKRGKKPIGVSSYSRVDCAQQFGIPKWYINDILRQNQNAIENIPHDQMTKLHMKLIDLGMLDGDKITTDMSQVYGPTKESKMQVTHDGPEKDAIVPKDSGAGKVDVVESINTRKEDNELPDTTGLHSGPEYEANREPVISKVSDFSNMEIKPTQAPELSNEIHNSNRILKMDARVKEIKDYIQNYRNAYRDELIAAWNKQKVKLNIDVAIDLPDSPTLTMFSERSAFVDVLDVIIEKLDKI